VPFSSHFGLPSDTVYQLPWAPAIHLIQDGRGRGPRMINIGNLRILDVTFFTFAVALANTRHSILLNPLEIDVIRTLVKKSQVRGGSNR
jgi:hypothetical protein